jgi:L-aminopeptidase/D-esterase-like protein
MKKGSGQGLVRQNTTLVVVATNALLTKVDANRLAHIAQLGMARTINPVNTTSDGDLVIALSIGTEKARIDALGVAASEAVAESILRAVRQSAPLGGLPGLKRV